MARPEKLTPEVQKRITDALKLGATYELAAKYGGITYKTFRNWLERGEREGRGRYYLFLVAVEDAEAKAAMSWLAKIEKAAADGDWKAAAWKLERRFAGEFGRRVHEITGKDGGPVEHRQVQELSDEELAHIAGQGQGV